MSRIELPDDLSNRLEEFARGAGRNVDEFVREAIETRLALEEQLRDNLEGWTDADLRDALRKGLDDLEQGRSREYDQTTLPGLFEGVKERGRKRLEEARNRRPH